MAVATSMLYDRALISPYRPVESTVRHNRWLATACPLIQSVLHGKRAQQLKKSIPESGMLACLPMWLWMLPAPGALGKKSGDIMPARATFAHQGVPGIDQADAGLVIVEDEAEIGYTVTGLGREESGVLRILESTGGRDDSPAPATATVIPEQIACRRLSAEQLGRRLNEIEAAGQEAWWTLLMEMESFVRKAVDRSHSAATRELNATLGVGETGFLDPEGIEEVVNNIVLDSPEEKQSAAMKVIDRLLEPHRFKRVDPQKYLSTELSRTAGQRLRARIGDPHIGQRIRRMRQQMPQASEAELLAAYRQDNPKDALSTTRLRRALSVRPDTSVSAVPLSEDICPSLDETADPLVHLSRGQALEALAGLDLDSTDDIERVRARVLEVVDDSCLDDDVLAKLIVEALEGR